MGQSLDGIVVQIDMRDLDGFAGGPQAIRIHCVAVILRTDRDFSSRQILAWLISAVMTKFQFVRPSMVEQC